MSIIESIEDLKIVISVMRQNDVPYLKVGEIEISRPTMPDIKVTPHKDLTPEQQAQVYDADLFNLPRPTFKD